MDDMPSVTMKEGIRSLELIAPLRKPNPVPIATAIRTPSSPKLKPFRSFATSNETVRAETAMMPSTDRSIAPISSTNVRPVDTAVSRTAASATFCRFWTLRNCGLRIEKTPIMASKAAEGPQACRLAVSCGRRRRKRCSGGMALSPRLSAAARLAGGGASEGEMSALSVGLTSCHQLALRHGGNRPIE